nr:MAG TPA: hypothetical protein [Bacteriophage sp.]
MFVLRTFNGQWCVYSDQGSKTLLLLYIQMHTIQVLPPRSRSRNHPHSLPDDHTKRGCRGLRACPRHGAT